MVGGDGGEGRTRVGAGVVSDWVVADDPGVHVYSAGLDEDAFGGLKSMINMG